jgi:hypothetical protein
MQTNAPRAGWFRCTRTSAGAKTAKRSCCSAAIPSGLDGEVIDYIARIGAMRISCTERRDRVLTVACRPHVNDLRSGRWNRGVTRRV